MGGSNRVPQAGGLNTWTRSPPGSGGWKSKRKVSAGLVSPEPSPLWWPADGCPWPPLCTCPGVSVRPGLLLRQHTCQTGPGPPRGPRLTPSPGTVTPGGAGDSASTRQPVWHRRGSRANQGSTPWAARLALMPVHGTARAGARSPGLSQHAPPSGFLFPRSEPTEVQPWRPRRPRRPSHAACPLHGESQALGDEGTAVPVSGCGQSEASAPGGRFLFDSLYPSQSPVS